MRVPDAIEPAVGFRVWQVIGGILHSFNQGMRWEPNMVAEAYCKFQDHEPPVANCRCGIYAAANFNRLFEMGYTKTEGMWSADAGELLVAGQVSLWGTIIPGQLGWRAQYAYPKKLLVPYNKWKVAKELAETYNIPFKLYNLERKH